jgi:hypothetical protein
MSAAFSNVVLASVDIVTTGVVSIEPWDEALLEEFEKSEPLDGREPWTVEDVVLSSFRWTNRRTATSRGRSHLIQVANASAP